MPYRCPLAAATLLLCSLLASTDAQASTPASKVKPTPPPAVPEMQYAKAPPALRDYLLKAREADRITDPMARCQAFPAPPGSNWDPNLLKAHCAYVFGPQVALKDIKARLDSGDLEGLDQVFRALLDRHFSETDFSEDIHAAFALFDDSYEAGRLSKLWLEQAPGSAFAMAARASFFEDMSWAARGAKYAEETPKENLARMSEFQDKALDLYSSAIRKEPRLLDAYIGIVYIDERGKSVMDADEAFARARKIDPACKALMSARMDRLRPRWGGSYPQMMALEQEILPHLARRPLLALSRIWPYEDLNDSLYRLKRYEEAVKALQPMVAVSSSPQVFEELAMSLASQDKADRWLQLSYLVEATRFRKGRSAVARSRGRQQLLLARDFEMANASLMAAVAEDPEDAYSHYLLAASYSGLGKLDDAEREYGIAMKDPENRRDSLAEVIGVLMRAGQQGRAKAHAETLTREYPDYARAWWLKARAYTPGPIEPIREALETFLAKADPTDPTYSMDVLMTRRGLEQMKAEVLRTGGKW